MCFNVNLLYVPVLCVLYVLYIPVYLYQALYIPV